MQRDVVGNSGGEKKGREGFKSRQNMTMNIGNKQLNGKEAAEGNH